VVDTRKVAGRRTLKFTTAAEVIAEIERLSALQRMGKVQQLGNWSLGTTLNHLAEFIDYAYVGFPPDLNPPPVMKFVLKFLKGAFLKRPLPAGYRIPGIEGGTKATQEVGLDEGATRCLHLWRRLATEPPRLTHPIFGTLKHEEWIAGHLRHAELHLSFYLPKQ
jgi:hypothetical protein